MQVTDLFLFCFFQFFIGSEIHKYVDDIHINVDSRNFVDSYGRERFFHGTNVALKTFPWYPDGKNGNTFNETDMIYLKSIGMNIVRLGFAWVGVMPEFGVINITYLVELEKIVNKLQKYGIYTLLDSHQDIFGEQFCGNGFPKMDGSFLFPTPLRFPFSSETKTPSPSDCEKVYWGNYYFSFGVARAFEMLYTNENGLRDYFTQAWVAVAKYFKSNTAVIGYNLINEPFVGAYYRNPLLLIPEIANERIMKFQESVSAGIRKEDDKKIIFFEGVTFAFYATGIQFVPGGENYRNRSSLSFHYYKPPNISPEITVDIYERTSKNLGIGRMLTEFAAHTRYKETMNVLNSVIKAANNKLISWISWQYKCFYQPRQNSDECDTFNEDKNNMFIVNVESTKQIYPMIVSGNTISFSYNPDTKKFYFEYVFYNNKGGSQTVIYCGKTPDKLKVLSLCQVKVDIEDVYNVLSHTNCQDGQHIIVTN